jgi:predicted DCC family thiol-disulfide oxidoreductase YuxK
VTIRVGGDDGRRSMSRPQPPTEAPIWLFDSVCVICSYSVRFTLRNERHPLIRFVAIQSAEGTLIAARHGLAADDPETFLFIEGGRALTKSDGVVALSRHLRWPARTIGWIGVLPRPVRDWLYDRLAKNRYRLFGRFQTCMVPDAAARARFALPDNVPPDHQSANASIRR